MGVFLWLAYHADVKPREVWEAIKGVGWKPACFAMVCHCVQTLCILLRNAVLTPAELYPGLHRIVYAVGVGHALNTYLPARAGDVLKCFLLSKGRKGRLSTLSAAGVVVADRILDVLTLFAMAVVWRADKHTGLQAWLRNYFVNWSWIQLLTVCVLAITTALFVVRGSSYFAARWTGEFRSGMRCLFRPSRVVVAVLLAIVAWSAEAYSVIFLANALGGDLSFSNGLLVIVALNFAISLPVSFANLGPFEAAIALTLTSFGMSSNSAFAAATVHHGLQLLTIGVWGWACFLTRPKEKLARRSR